MEIVKTKKYLNIWNISNKFCVLCSYCYKGIILYTAESNITYVDRTVNKAIYYYINSIIYIKQKKKKKKESQNTRFGILAAIDCGKLSILNCLIAKLYYFI